MADNGLPEKEKAPYIFGVTGSSIKGIVILLLALGVCFSYFYFFTDVLRPNAETPNQTDISGTEVKKPLPQRAVQNAATSAAQTARVAPVSPAPQAETPAKPAVTSRKQEQAPTKTPETSPKAPVKSVSAVSKPTPSVQKPATASVEPAPLPAKQKESVKKAAISDAQKVPAGKSPHSTVTAKPTEKTVAAKAGSKGSETSLPQKKSAGNEQKTVISTPVKQKTMPAKQSDVSESKDGEVVGKTLSKKEGKGFSLVVGTYVLQSNLKADKAKLERAGVHPSVVTGPKKNQTMNRLVMAEFDSYTTARAELDRVKKASKGAFILQENGKFTIYAGSYYRHEWAVEEQERLRSQGFSPILKKSVAPVGSWKLTVGGFPTREAAQEEAAKLRKLGFKPFPTQSGTK